MGNAPISHNYAHDVESFWWLLLWFVIAQVDHEGSRELAETIFLNSGDAVGRRFITFVSHLGLEEGRTIHPSLSQLISVFETSRSSLYEFHCQRSRESLYHDKTLYPADFEAVHGLVDDITRVLNDNQCSRLLGDLKVYGGDTSMGQYIEQELDNNAGSQPVNNGQSYNVNFPVRGFKRKLSYEGV